MSLASAALYGALSLVSLAGAGLALRWAGESLRRLAAVLTGARGVSAVDGETSGLFAVRGSGAGPDGDAGRLVAVTDAFGYWCLRELMSRRGFRRATVGGEALLALLYGDGTTRGFGSRLRAGRVVPEPLPVEDDAGRRGLSVGSAGRPLQRLEADGGTVPALLFLTPLAVVVGALVVEPLAGRFLPGLGRWLAVTPVWEALAAGWVALAVGGKVYHDTALVGGWDTVVQADGATAPVAAADAAGTADPPGTARACLREVAVGDRVLLLGRVRADADGVELVDGVVTTRGRGFLALASTVGAAKGLAAVGGFLAAAAATGYLAWLAV